MWARSLQTLRPWGAEHSARVIWQASGAGLLLVGLALLVTPSSSSERNGGSAWMKARAPDCDVVADDRSTLEYFLELRTQAIDARRQRGL